MSGVGTQHAQLRHEVAKFTDISRPRLAHQQIKSIVREPDVVALLCQKMDCQGCNISGALAQRWHNDVEFRDAMKKVAPESARVHRALEISVCGGDQANVRRNFSMPA